MKTRNAIVLAMILLAGMYGFYYFRNTARLRYFDGPNRVPYFLFADHLNKEMDSRAFLGKITYLQFIDGGIGADIELVRRIIFEWQDSPLQLILVAEDISNISELIGINTKSLIFVSDRQNEIRSKFRVTQGHHYLIDAQGTIVFHMGNEFGYSDGLKYSLNKAILGIDFELSDLVEEGLPLSNRDWFTSLMPELKGEISCLALFYSICGGCNSGMIFEKLVELNKTYGRQIRFVVILSRKYDLADINNAQTQLNTDLHMIIADEKLQSKWSELVALYRESDLSGIVLFVDSSGTVRRLHRSNESGLFKSLESEIKQIIEARGS